MTAAGCWVTGVGGDHPFGIDHLPYGAAATGSGEPARLVVRIGDFGLDLAAACERLRPDLTPLVEGPVLNPLLAAGVGRWREIRTVLQEWLADDRFRDDLSALLLPVGGLTMQLPIEVADYVDFYASEQHATNVGRILRPESEPLPVNWKSLPAGYHGRAGTVVVSGTPVRRPLGQWRGEGEVIEFGPSTRLDFEAEVGFVVGGPTRLGEAVPLAGALDHIFGVALVNDWSARDIQAWETVPLGPFLGKSFATSMAAWITPLDALAGAWVSPPPRERRPLAYLDDSGRADGLRLDLVVALNGEVISRPPFAAMYWTPAQLLAHLTVNGASLRAGDLFASGTVSGPDRDQWGSLLELSWGGRDPLTLRDGSQRTFLADGDEVLVTATAQIGSRSLKLGEVRGSVYWGYIFS